MLPSSVDAASLQVGEQVTVTYEEGADGSASATTITPMQQ
jgi:hypothetical protein